MIASPTFSGCEGVVTNKAPPPARTAPFAQTKRRKITAPTRKRRLMFPVFASFLDISVRPWLVRVDTSACRSVPDDAIHHRHDDSGMMDLLRRDLEEIALEDHEVGELADFYRAHCFLQPDLIGSAQRIGANGVGEADALIDGRQRRLVRLVELATAGGDLDRLQGTVGAVVARGGPVGAERDANALSQHRSDEISPVRPLLAPAAG